MATPGPTARPTARPTAVPQPPKTPANVHALGDGDGTKAKLRWDAVGSPAPTSYEAQYVAEDCGNGPCQPDGTWSTKTLTSIMSMSPPPGQTGPLVTEGELVGLSNNTLYQVRVRSVKGNLHSGWSDSVWVYTTSEALGDVKVATSPFHGYVRKIKAGSNQGSFEFPFVICKETIERQITHDANGNIVRTKLRVAADIRGAVKTWADAVTWKLSGGNNLILTAEITLDADKRCSGDWPIVNHNVDHYEIKFVDDSSLEAACSFPDLFRRSIGPPACWRSSSWENSPVQLIQHGSVLLNNARKTVWHTKPYGLACNETQRLVAHEVGHGLGIGKGTVEDLNQHPENGGRMITGSEQGQYNHCTPQPYDVVAVKALYQSR